MKSTAGAIAVLAAVLACGSARADSPREMFCVAVRTVPNLDQDNYVMSASGPVYMTPSFTTDLADDQLRAQWRDYIQPKHPVAYPNNPEDACQPANTRRALIAAQRGDIRNRSIAWTPAQSPAK